MKNRREIRALAVGDRFMRSCRAEHRARVWSIHNNVVNLLNSSGLLAMALPQAGGSSRFLTVSRLPELEPGDVLQLSHEAIELCGTSVTLTNVPVWHGPLPCTARADLRAEDCAEFCEVVHALAIRPVVNGEVPLEPHTVEHWIGLGPGLTPAGDDVVLGYLAMDNHLGQDAAWSQAMHEAVAAHLGRTTLLSGELLRCALECDYHETIQQVLAIFCGLSAENLRSALRRLARVGATSGESMIYGMWLALQHIAHGEMAILSTDRTAFYSERKSDHHMLKAKEQSGRMAALFSLHDISEYVPKNDGGELCIR